MFVFVGFIFVFVFVSSFIAHRVFFTDFFIVPACFDLRRLLPAAQAKLAEQWRVQLFNDDRALPERVVSSKRFTLIPWVSVDDVLALKSDARLSSSVVDVLIRGLMCTDERLLALRHLLTPEVLASDRVTAAMAAASASFRVLPATGLKQLVSISFPCFVVKKKKHFFSLFVGEKKKKHFFSLFVVKKRSKKREILTFKKTDNGFLGV